MIVILAPEISYVEYILSKCKYNKNMLGRYEIYECILNNKKFLILITQYGKVNISSSITILHNNYKCIKLIQMGTAGSINGSQHIFDVCISKVSLQFDINFTALGYANFTLPQEKLSLFNADEELIYKLKRACEIKDINYNVGVVGTSDSFLNNTSTANCLNKKFGIQSIDCECGSVGQIAYNLKIPFVGIKVISNFANNNAVNQYCLYDNEAVILCEKIILIYLKNFDN